MRLSSMILICALVGCKSKNEHQGVNLVVTEKGDTLAYFNYTNDKLKRYEFFSGQNNLGKVIEDRRSQSKLIGEFRFGCRDKMMPLNRLLGFSGVSISKFTVRASPQMPFLHEEFDFVDSYDVKLITNQIDSLDGQPRKTEVQIAIDRVTRDTLIYQESSYAFRMPEQKELILTLLIYDDRGNRKNMLDLLNDVKEKVNRYSKTQEQ